MPDRLPIGRSFVTVLLALVVLGLTVGCSDDHSPLKPAGETTATPPAPVGATSVAQGDTAIYTTTQATSSLGDTLEYRFQFAMALDDLNPEYSAWSRDTTVMHPWPAPGSYEVRAQARCATHHAATSSLSPALAVSVIPETLSVPTQPSGPTTGNDGDQPTFTTGGSVSSQGHAVQYRMKVIDPSNDVDLQVSGWSATPSFTFTWTVAGTYTILAQARCARDTLAMSNVSAPLIVTVQPPGPPIVTGAVLSFMVADTVRIPLNLHRALASWNESDLTWNSMPAVSDSLAPCVYATNCTFECETTASFQLDTALVQAWVDGTSSNDGLAVIPGATNKDIPLLKRETFTIYPSAATITWHYQGESLVRSRTILLSADTYTNEAQPSTNFNSASYLIAGRAGGAEKRIFIKFDPSLP